MTYLGLLNQLLGLLDISKIFWNESNSAQACLIHAKKFQHEGLFEEAHSNPLVNNTLYRKLASCLIYLTHTRPGMSYGVSVESRHMGESHGIH